MSRIRDCAKILLHVIDLLWAIGGFALCTFFWIGRVVKDADTSLIWFYLMPPLFVGMLAFIWLFLTLRYRFRLLQLYVFITMIFCFIKVLVIDHRWNKQPTQLPENNIRILHWNTARGVLGVESIVRTMQDDNPDIIMMSEPPRVDMLSDIAYHALGMEHIFTDAGMSLASHYPIKYLGTIALPAGAGWHARVETGAGPLDFAAVDIVSRPNLDRNPSFQALASWIDRRTSSAPLVVMGDFNTPHDAASLKPIRARMLNAYEQGGRGWPYTWPVPLPLYAIDQTWVEPGIKVNDFHLLQARFSDHKRQVVDISFVNRASAAAEKSSP